MKKNKKEPDINKLFDDLVQVLNELKVTAYINSLYTSYDECEWDHSLNNFTLYETIVKDTSYQLLDAIKAIIKVLFDWDYKMEAKFDVNINEYYFNITFYEPVITYKTTSKMFSLEERKQC
jgi:hypothetical protein